VARIESFGNGCEYARAYAGLFSILPMDECISILVQFIADIRGARVRELEEKRINKEMANIRKRFKGVLIHITFGLEFDHLCRGEFGWLPEEKVRSWYSLLIFVGSDLNCRYVAKVIFTYILGYKVDIGHMEAVNLISSPKYSEKQIVSLSRSESMDCEVDIEN
jgi:AP-2 complex subunit alpha